MLSPAETALLAGLDTDPLLARTLGWAAINSGSDNLDGLATMADQLAHAFAPLGDVCLTDGAPSTDVTPQGHARPRAHGRHLRVRVRPDAPAQVLLTGHMDTVYGADHAFQTCRDLGGGRVNGPGTADMKGGLAVMHAALGAFEASDGAARLGWTVLIVSDEEVGSPSSAALLAGAAAAAHWGLTYEPSSLPDGTFAGARWGSGNFSAVVTGRAAHAGRDPENGRNALTAAADLALRLEAAIGPDLRVNPARLDGGGPNNVVPAGAVLRFNVRPRSLAAQAAAERAIGDAVAAVSAARGVEIALHGGFGRPPKPLDPVQQRLFVVVESACASLGLPFATRETGGVCDGNNLAAAGLPVVDTLGVRGGAIHSPDEYLIVESLAERAQLSALLLHRLATAA